MTEKTLRQLELPILADINSKFVEDTSTNALLKSLHVDHDIAGFHQPASKEDESIYQLMSESYFSNSKK